MDEVPPSRADAIAPGALIAGKYRLDRKLGEGGMGTVFLANNEVLQQRVVVKATHNAHPRADLVARFLREARAAAKIQNEHVARVLDFGTLPSGAPFLVMEYLEGRDLEHELQERGPLPIGEAVERILQTLDGLAVAHDVGIVHRDIKPANLMVAKRQGGGEIVKILDFGIAKSDDGPSSAALTTTDTMMGSPLYMSPEQLRSAKYVDPRSDLWAIGVVLYQLLTGKPPFDGEGIGDLVPAIMSMAPPPPRSLRPEIPIELERIVLWCLEKKPADRPVDARTLASALGPFAALRATHSEPSISTPLAVSSAAPPVTSVSAAAVSVASTGSTAGQTVDAVTQTRSAPGRRRVVASLAVALTLATVGVALRLRSTKAHPPLERDAPMALNSQSATPPSPIPSAS